MKKSSSIARLMSGRVTEIAEDDFVFIFMLILQTYVTLDVFINLVSGYYDSLIRIVRIYKLVFLL